jgi:hypothetical protein
MIRQIKKGDYPQIEHINHNMDLKKIHELERQNVVLVLVEQDMVRGYVAYRMSGKYVVINDLFVDCIYRRTGIATQLLFEILERMARTNKTCMKTSVSHWDTDLHLFLKDMGFKAKVSKEDSSVYDFEFCPKKVVA